MSTLRIGTIVVGTLGLACLSLCTLYAQQAPQKPAKTVGGALPGQVAKLTLWPTVEQRTGKIIPNDASKWALRAKNNSVEWIEKVIDPQWLPENPQETLSKELVSLQHAYENLDTSHVEWQKNGYRFRVNQTKTVFYLDVTPMQGKISDGDIDATRNASREIASKFLTDIAVVKAPMSDGEINIAPAGTKSILLGRSFDAANVEQCADGIVAFPARVDAEDKLDRTRWDYWWRRTGWWTNGQTLGVFILKTEGGAWRADYGSSLDEHWFTPPPSSKKSE